MSEYIANGGQTYFPIQETSMLILCHFNIRQSQNRC